MIKIFNSILFQKCFQMFWGHKITMYMFLYLAEEGSERDRKVLGQGGGWGRKVKKQE